MANFVLYKTESTKINQNFVRQLFDSLTSQLLVSAVLSHLSRQFLWTSSSVPLHLQGVIKSPGLSWSIPEFEWQIRHRGRESFEEIVELAEEFLSSFSKQNLQLILKR